MPSKKSTKVPPACLDPKAWESLGSSVHDHQLGPVLAAEYMGRSVTNPTFRADLVGVEAQWRPCRARRAIEPIGDQLIGVFWAKARIEGVAAAAGGTDHALGERS